LLRIVGSVDGAVSRSWQERATRFLLQFALEVEAEIQPAAEAPALKSAAKIERVFPPIFSYDGAMKRDEVLRKLKEAEADLRAKGVAHAALFGSLARGEDQPGSDIDILVDLDPEVVVTIFDYVGVKDFISDMFNSPVDVVSREGLKPFVRPKATADAIYAF
jgi:predicted nucleotidyltransferase